VRRDVEVFLAVEQDPAPGRDVGREAEAQERQRRLGDDRRGDVDRAGDDHRPERVGQDVANHLARHRGAEGARRLDEFLFAQREELGPDQARDRHPAEAADHEHDQDEDADLGAERRLQRLAKEIDQDQQQRQLRQRQEQVGHPHQGGVDGAARNAGDGADRHADEHRHQHRRQADRERDAAAVEHAREDVLAEVVGAERMGERRRRQARGEVDLVDLQRPDHRPEGDHQDHRRQDDEAEHRQLVAAKAAPCLGRGREVARARRCGRGGRRRRGRQGHASDS
jgi:hypothetical protein